MSAADSHGRDDVARALDSGLGESGVVICGLGSGSRAWRELGSTRPAYYCSDPMGVSLSMAAGFALARPDLPVALMVGDGDLLMGLGALVTVAGASPANLSVVVLANLRYETGGGRPLPGSSRLDIAAVAAAAGWASVSVAGSDLADDIAASLQAPGPSLSSSWSVRLQAAPYGGPGRWSGVEERVQFELALAATDAAAQAIHDRGRRLMPPSPPTPPLMGSVLLRNGCLLAETGDLETADLLIEDGLITGRGSGAGRADRRRSRSTLQGSLVVPGLVNAHTHSNQTLEKGLCDALPLDAWMVIASYGGAGALMGPEDLRIAALMGAVEMLRTGTTSVVDCARVDASCFAEGLDAIMNAYVDSGMRAGVAAQYADLDFFSSLPLELIDGGETLLPTAQSRSRGCAGRG